MSKYGMKIAFEYGKKLKKFHDISKAEDYFFSYKDNLLKKLESFSAQNSYFLPDYTVESLKKIEKWYFDLYEKGKFHKFGFTRNKFERIMSVYFGEVAVKNNNDAKWLVEEYAFLQNRYQLLVNREGLNMAVVNLCHDLYKEENNKRKNLLFRTYNKYFVR